MPELPEVETVRVGLERWAVGRRIAAVELFGPRTVRRHEGGPADFVNRLTGRRVEAACRRGKYLWLPLSDTEEERGLSPATSDEVAGNICLVAHLGMSGQFLAVPPGTPDQPHLR